MEIETEFYPINFVTNWYAWIANNIFEEKNWKEKNDNYFSCIMND